MHPFVIIVNLSVIFAFIILTGPLVIIFLVLRIFFSSKLFILLLLVMIYDFDNERNGEVNPNIINDYVP
jgi:hypothetical protein